MTITTAPECDHCQTITRIQVYFEGRFVCIDCYNTLSNQDSYQDAKATEGIEEVK